jgi:nitric oxide dioxygenase
MNDAQIKLVQQSFEAVKPISEQAAALFYGRLFELDPELEMLFKADLKEQGRKLMAMIGMAVDALSDLPALVPVVQDLGRRHVAYGVETGHYDTVGQALIWTLEQGLGAAFTSEVRQAWLATYTLLADTMKAAAYDKAA